MTIFPSRSRLPPSPREFSQPLPTNRNLADLEPPLRSPGSMEPMEASPPPCVGLSAAELLLKAASAVPPAHYLLAAALLLLALLYNFLEFHLLGDLLRGLRGGRVALTFDPASEIYLGVVSKCRILHGRYLPTPWLASPHLQTTFLNFFGRPPSLVYRRQLFTVRDGGTIALDWLLVSDVAKESPNKGGISKDVKTPIVVVIPGLTSDSASAYVRHIVYSMANHGWNVIVSNHRGLGGVSITSDCFYNAGWTEDAREVINYLHEEYPHAPLFAIGTSIGANILVKYLGEDGERTPVAGAVSVCSPWDLVVCDRFICRKLVQRLYDRALAIGLKGYAQLHQPVLTRLANWEGIRKSRSVRDFDNHATRIVAKFETVDTYYRRCSSVTYIGNVAVPLLCISALDDPVCTREAIPWDECRANKNIVLATTARGGHLAYFQGLTARRLWWVGAVREFLSVLHDSPHMHGQKKTQDPALHPSQSSIDRSPYVNIMGDGMVAALVTDGADTNDSSNSHTSREDGHTSHEVNTKDVVNSQPIHESTEEGQTSTEVSGFLEQKEEERSAKSINDLIGPVKRSISKLSQHQGASMWLLAYIAIINSWPLLGSLAFIIFRKKLPKSFLSIKSSFK